MKKLLLLFFFGTMAYAQPNINSPMDLTSCESNPGMAAFDLTINSAIMLDGLTPSLYSVKYYETMSQASFGGADDINPYNYVSMNNMVYARVTEIADSSNYTVASFELMVVPTPANVDLPAIEHCLGPIDLTVNENLIDGFNTVSYYTTSADAEANMNALAFPQSYISESSAVVWVRVENSSGCYRVLEQELILSGDITTVTIMMEAQTITFVAQTEGDYQYSLDNGPWQDDPNFYNISYGIHTGKIQDACGNVMAYTFVLTPMTPTGQADQTFNEGDSLADIEIDGENIQWYDNSGEMPDFPDGMDEPLPLSTVLVDGTTYYASQTIDGVESAERFAVTVHTTAAIETNTFNNLSFYPNPIANVLNIENANGIDRIKLTNALGQSVFTNTVNSNSAQVDVSSLSKGVYFVTIASGSASKTIKIIKE